MSIRVGVCGAMGRMGRESVRAILGAPDMDLTLLVDLVEGNVEGRPCVSELDRALRQSATDVMVDFTHPQAALPNALACLAQGVAPVIGTSGLGEQDLHSLEEASRRCGTPALVVPNFAIGAVLMMRFAEEAARWMPEVAILEMHHPGKADAPSGTAIHTAERVARGRPAEFTPPSATRLIKADGALGAQVAGVSVHSIRLSGLVAHQVVTFGAQGETLTIRHDSLDRSSFMPGLLLAIRKVRALSGLAVGLEPLMFG